MDGGCFPIEPWNDESEHSSQLPDRDFALIGEGLFLWFVSFGPAKEMNSRESAKALDLPWQSNCKNQKQLSPEGELLFFAGAKKSSQKKAPFS